MNLNEYAKEVFEANQHWWTDLNTGKRLIRNKDTLFMLIVSELAEAMEGERKNLMDDHLPHRKMAEVELADTMIRIFDYAGAFEYDLNTSYGIVAIDNEVNPEVYDYSDKGAALMKIVREISDASHEEEAPIAGVVVFLASAIDRIIKYCEHFGYDLEGAIKEKRAYNATRKDHTKEARLAANGKKW